MKAKHTPAPWHTGEKYPEDIYANRAGHAIARCVNEQYAGECEANAKLIAAAPELLEALIMVRDADNDCKLDGLKTIPYASRAKIDAAIAKATGEQA
jgi:hypothetical protein